MGTASKWIPVTTHCTRQAPQDIPSKVASCCPYHISKVPYIPYFTSNCFYKPATTIAFKRFLAENCVIDNQVIQLYFWAVFYPDRYLGI